MKRIVIVLLCVCFVISCFSSCECKHEFEEKVIKEATCSNKGDKQYTCSKCEYSYTEEGGVPATGQHKFNSNSICTVCSSINMSDVEKEVAAKVKSLKNGKIVYDVNEKAYIFTFELRDSESNAIKSSCLVDIRIIDSDNYVVYENSVLVKTSDYDNNVATIKIKTSDFTKTHDNAITFYYKIYNNEYFSFSESEIDTVFLNISDVPLTYQGAKHKVLISDIKYRVRREYFDTRLDIYLSGEIISCSGAVNYIGYTLLDADGYLVKESGTYIDAHKTGDRFKDEVISIVVNMGESYTIIFD